jgi:patatin-like phospholipase/acyl hydrolase
MLPKLSLSSLCLLIIISLPLFSYANGARPIMQKQHVRILSIDGGGIRGIIPLIILKNLESRLKDGKHLSECFDIMAGTSTGGIIVLLLSTPDQKGRPKYKAHEVLELYKTLGKQAFQTSLWQNIKTGAGWWNAKYSASGLERILESYFEAIELKDTLTNVIVPAYEIEQDKTYFFKTTLARSSNDYNYYLKDIARATSAAPAYFKPAQVANVSSMQSRVFVDGGLAANNPTISAAVYAADIYGHETPFYIVSLGTGTNYGAKSKLLERNEVENSGFLGWAKKIIPTMMYAVNAVTDYEMRHIFNYNKSHMDYYRFQPIIEAIHSDMDNVSPSNIEALEQYAEQIINENEDALQNIADVLNQERS